MCKLLLVRHGETVDNVNKIMQGQTQGCLTLHGIEQAQLLAQRLADTAIDAFVSSDLRRAIDTCAILARPHLSPGTADADIVRHIDTTPLLRERDWGSFTGHYIPDLQNARWTDDIESIDALLARAARFIGYVRSRYHGKTVLAVGHGIINKAIQSVYHNKPMSEIKRMENAEVRTLIFD